MRSLCWGGLALLSFALMSGCLIVAEPFDPTTCSGNGNLEVEWLFNGNGSFCPDDVKDIVIQVTNSEGVALHSNEQGDAFTCEKGSAYFSSVACGRYNVKVRAVDPNDSFSWEAPTVSVVVKNGGRSTFSVNLLPAP